MQWRSLAIALLALISARTALAEVVIHREQSLYRMIFVTEEGRERCLKFARRMTASMRETCIDTTNPDRHVFSYTRSMIGALYLAPEPRSALIIGLGGGVLATTLAKLRPDLDIDTVEIDPAVTRIAEKFFDFKRGPHLRVTEEDGRVFVKRAAKAGAKYDLIMLDAYDHQYIPEHLLTREFLEEVKSILAPGGVLAANTFTHNRLYDNESATYEAVYGQFFNLKTNNRVILTKLDGVPSHENLTRNAAALAPQLRRFGIEGDAILKQFSTEKDWKSDARVLTDQYSPSNLLNGG
jgi:spermidine synthase